MQTNLDRLDRILRGTFGIWLVFIAISATRRRRRTTAIAAVIAGVGLLQNALVGFCGLNQLFEIDTTGAESSGA